jgi:hypothetical protein
MVPKIGVVSYGVFLNPKRDVRAIWFGPPMLRSRRLCLICPGKSTEKHELIDKAFAVPSFLNDFDVVIKRCSCQWGDIDDIWKVCGLAAGRVVMLITLEL